MERWDIGRESLGIWLLRRNMLVLVLLYYRRLGRTRSVGWDGRCRWEDWLILRLSRSWLWWWRVPREVSDPKRGKLLLPALHRN
jgi:hypothetical protein